MTFYKNGVFGAHSVGLVVVHLMSIITEYYTAMGKRPVMTIVRQVRYRSCYEHHWRICCRNGKYFISNPCFSIRYLWILCIVQVYMVLPLPLQE